MAKIKLLLVRCFFIPFSLLPLNWSQSLGAFLGRLVIRFNKKRRHIIQCNLEACFPDLTSEQRLQLADKVAAETGKWVLESADIWFGKPEKLIQNLSAKNPDMLKEAYAKNRGVVIVLPHFGNWEMMNFFLPQHYPAASMYKPLTSKTMEEVVLGSRSREGAKLFKADSKGVRQAFKFLRKGGALVVLSDHLPSREAGVYAPFFGMPALTGKLTHALIKQNQSEALLATIKRKPKGKGFELEFHPIEDMRIDDGVEAATRLNRAIEKSILMAPEQYQWVYTRFDKQPKGTKNIYK